jgi:hypothetical protein
MGLSFMALQVICISPDCRCMRLWTFGYHAPDAAIAALDRRVSVRGHGIKVSCGTAP